MLSLAIAHRLVLVAEGLDGEHRPEGLVLGHRHATWCSASSTVGR